MDSNIKKDRVARIALSFLKLSYEWNVDTPHPYQVLEEDIDSKSHKQDEECQIDISFDIEIFFFFESSDPLDKYSK